MKKKIINILQDLFLVICSIIFLFVVSQKFIFKKSGIFGYRTFVIVTNSMSPDIMIGDVILIRTAKAEEIKIGDIVTYYGKEADFKNKIVTHKVMNIVKKDEQYIFYTKGNATTAMDPAVTYDMVYGKMVYKSVVISFLSKIIRSKLGFVFCVVVPLVFILVGQMFNLKKELKDGKKIVNVDAPSRGLENTLLTNELKREIKKEIEKDKKKKNESIFKKLFKKKDKKIIIAPKEEIKETIIEQVVEEQKTIESHLDDKEIVVEEQKIEIKEKIPEKIKEEELIVEKENDTKLEKENLLEQKVKELCSNQEEIDTDKRVIIYYNKEEIQSKEEFRQKHSQNKKIEIQKIENVKPIVDVDSIINNEQVVSKKKKKKKKKKGASNIEVNNVKPEIIIIED